MEATESTPSSTPNTEENKNSDVATQLQRTKKLMIAAVVVIVVLIAAAVVAGGYWAVYVSTSENAVQKTLKQALPLPAGSVNGTTLSLRQLDKRVAATSQFYKKQAELQLGLAQDPGADAVRQQEFDRLVDEALLMQYAKEKNVTVSQEEIDAYFTDTILPQAQGGQEEVSTTLQDLYGWTIDDFKAEVLKETVLREKLQKQMAAEGGEESPEKKAINQAYADVTTGGKAFEDVAKDVSDDTGSAAQGGKLGAITKGQTVKEFEEKAFSAEIGKVTEPFQSQFGWHILIVNSRDDAAGSADVSHILISGKQVQDIVDEKRVNAKIKAYIPGISTEAAAAVPAVQ